MPIAKDCVCARKCDYACSVCFPETRAVNSRTSAVLGALGLGGKSQAPEAIRRSSRSRRQGMLVSC
jgi:hypothetical protein